MLFISLFYDKTVKRNPEKSNKKRREKNEQRSETDSITAEESADGTPLCEQIESEVFEDEPESEKSFIEIFVKLATDWYEDLTSYELYEDVI